MTRFVPASAVWLVFTFAAITARSADRPNIVLIMADDMGFSDLGCYGSEIETPHLDRLAAEGLRFTQFYNNAKCTTTRASLITGLYPRREGKLLKQNMLTIAEVLAPAGYASFLSGKWHLGSTAPTRPSDRGFHHYYGLLDGAVNFFDPAQPDPPFKGGKVRWFGEDDRRITSFPEGFYTTDAFTDAACRYIDQAVAADRPFFLHVCYNAPHYPLHAPADVVAKYRGRYRAGWDALRRERHRRQIELGLVDAAWPLPPPGREVEDWASIDNQDYFDHLMAVYAAMVDRMDHNVSRILAKLDEHRLAQNTLVMFLSDNGGCAEKPGGFDYARTPGVKEFYTACGPGWAYAQNTPFRRYKSWVHEGGIATPFIVRWPAVVQPGTITNTVGHIIDVLPTCADVAGVEYPTERDGVRVLPCEGLTLQPLLEGGTRAGHASLCWEWAGNRAVREGPWKLCWDNGVKRWELYDVVADRTEMNDLANARPDLVKRLSGLWFTWAEATEVKVRQTETQSATP